MPIYKNYGFGLGATVVLDIGEAYTKLGFAGEAEPRAVIPTSIQEVGGPVTYIFRSDQTSVISKTSGPNFRKSIRVFLDKIYFKYLQVNPKDQRVILCESLLNPTKAREEIAHVLFTQFDVPSILFAPSHLLACYTIATGTALVLDCSYAETMAIPVVEGTPVLWALQSAPLGGSVIHDAIMEEIKQNGKLKVEDKPKTNVTERLTERVLEDIKVKACFVSDYTRAKKIQTAKMAAWSKEQNPDKETPGVEPRPSPPPDMIYPLDGVSRLFIPGSVREEAVEVLFQQDNERASLATLLLDCLLECPMDSRKSLAANILVTGGTSMLPGFRHRLLFELKELVQQEERYGDKLSAMEFRVHNPPTRANLVAWLGASIFASLDTFAKRSITKEYFEQHNKRLPDWCVLDLKTPEKLPERPSTLLTGKTFLPSAQRVGALASVKKEKS